MSGYIQRRSEIKEYQLKSKSMWFEEKKLPADGFFLAIPVNGDFFHLTTYVKHLLFHHGVFEARLADFFECNGRNLGCSEIDSTPYNGKYSRKNLKIIFAERKRFFH